MSVFSDVFLATFRRSRYVADITCKYNTIHVNRDSKFSSTSSRFFCCGFENMLRMFKSATCLLGLVHMLQSHRSFYHGFPKWQLNLPKSSCSLL